MRSLRVASVFLVVLAVGCFVKPIPQQTKIADIASSQSSATFVPPQTHGKPSEFEGQYMLLFGVPKGGRPLPTGTITLKDESGGVVAEWSVKPDELTDANWLDDESLDARIIDFNNRFPLERNRSYTVQIDFEEVPPDGLSLWLSYFE